MSEDRVCTFEAKPPTLLLSPLFPGEAPRPVLQQVVVTELGERGIRCLSVSGILELTKEETEERTDNSWR